MEPLWRPAAKSHTSANRLRLKNFAMVRRKSSTLVAALCCQDSLTRIPMWFSPVIGLTISKHAPAARLMNRLQSAEVGFGRQCEQRAQPARKNFVRSRKNARAGFCKMERRRWKQNLATDSPLKMN